MKRYLVTAALCMAFLTLGFAAGRSYAPDGGKTAAPVQTDYFLTFYQRRLDVRRMQADALDVLGDAQQLKALMQRCEAETRCELALSARYPQSAVWISQRGVFAAVRASALSQSERAQITLMLCRETGAAEQSVFLTVCAP